MTSPFAQACFGRKLTPNTFLAHLTLQVTPMQWGAAVVTRVPTSNCSR